MLRTLCAEHAWNGAGARASDGLPAVARFGSCRDLLFESHNGTHPVTFADVRAVTVPPLSPPVRTAAAASRRRRQRDAQQDSSHGPVSPRRALDWGAASPPRRPRWQLQPAESELTDAADLGSQQSLDFIFELRFEYEFRDHCAASGGARDQSNLPVSRAQVKRAQLAQRAFRASIRAPGARSRVRVVPRSAMVQKWVTTDQRGAEPVSVQLSDHYAVSTTVMVQM